MEKIYFSPKKLLCLFTGILLAVLFNSEIHAQGIPEGINYQAVARDTAGNPIPGNVPLAVRFTIFSGPTTTIDTLFSEVHAPVSTNIYGLFTLVIGTIDSIRFKNINWTSGDKYLEVKIAKVGNDYSMIHRTRLMSVPYALYAKSSGNSWKLDGNAIADTMFIGTINDKDFIIRTNDTARVRVAANGNVTILNKLGIGVISPNSPLTIRANTGDEIDFVSFAGDSADITSSPVLTIGTSTTSPLQFKTNGSAHVLIDSAGNVGIGSTSPLSKLDIIGKIKITDGTEGMGKVLISDTIGRGTWVIPDSGTVLSFSADSLLPLFSTTVTDDTINPHLSFSLENAGAYSIFGNNSGANAQPAYFTPQLASTLFQNQGAVNNVLHGNASGAPTWGQIVNADIAPGAVSLATNVTGILPMANGGTAASLTPVDGGIAYSNASSMQLTPAGTSGQVLVSGGTGSPVWTDPTGSITLTGISPVTATATNATNYDISVGANTALSAGIVSAGGANAHRVWKTDGSANPGWRIDSSGVYVAGTGLTLTGNVFNSVWTSSGSDIYSNNTGNVGIGLTNPNAKLEVQSSAANGSVGYFENTNASNPDNTLVTTTNGTSSKAFYASNTGLGGVAVISSNNSSNTSTALEINSNGSGNALWSINSGTGSAGKYEITGALNSSDALLVSSNGTGSAGNFNQTSAVSASPALQATRSNGLGRTASFISTHPSNTSDAVFITTNGNGSKGLNVSTTGAGLIENYGAYVTSTGSGASNIAGYFSAENATDNYAGIFENGNVGIGLTDPLAKLDVFTDGADDALYSETTGDGAAGRFYISNPSNSDYALDAYTDGIGDAINSENAGDGAAGSFVVSNASNTSSAVNVLSLGGISSAALSVTHLGTSAVDYGMQVFNLSTGGTNVGAYFTAAGATNNYAAIFDLGNVGIGTTTPSQKLHLTNGNVLLSNTNNTANKLIFSEPSTSGSNTTSFEAVAQAGNITYTLPAAYPTTNNQVLASTTGGTLSWASAGSLGAWSITGNAGTVASTNFIGTTDPIDFVIRTNNTEKIRVTSGGNLGIGIALPTAQLHVKNTTSGISGVGSGYFETTSSTNPYSAVVAKTNGSAEAGYFEVNNTGSSANAVLIKTNGNNSSKGLKIEQIGGVVSSTNYGLHVTNTSGGVNIAGYFSATGGSSNYAAIFENGNVGIGITSPINKLDVKGGTAIGNGYAGLPAPANGLLVQGNVSLGTTNTMNKLDVASGVAIGSTYAGLSLAPGNGAIIEGNVGIGTASATNKLTIGGITGTWENALLINPTSAAGSKRASLQTDDWTIGQDYQGNGTRDFFIYQNSAAVQRLFIGTTGNVGIGTTTALSKLDVEGSISIGTTYSGSTAAPTNGAIIEGNVGIGTSSPTSQVRLHILENAAYSAQVKIENKLVNAGASSQLSLYNDAGNSAFMLFGSSTNPTYAGTNGLAIGTSGPGKIQFWNSGATPRVTIDASGNVGIGTANPTTSLEVAGQIKITGGTPGLGKILTSDASGTGSWTTLSATTGTGTQNYITKWTSTGNALGNSQIYDNGTNVGIGTGTAVNSTLQVNGSTASAVYTITTSGTSTTGITLDATQSIIVILGTSTGGTTLTLPAANSAPGRVYFIKNAQNFGAGIVTLAKTGSDVIDGLGTYNVGFMGGAIVLSDGISGWYIIAKN